MSKMLQPVLAAMCILLLLATACLSLSLIVLNPPRANFPVWFALAAIFAGQSALTLSAVTMPHPPASDARRAGWADACSLWTTAHTWCPASRLRFASARRAVARSAEAATG